MFAGSSLAIDHNDDGVSDVWARYYEAEDLLAEDDTDGDGFTNLQESISWTDPRSARSRLQLEVDADGGEIALVWPEQTGVHYQIEASNDLAQWTGLSSFETTLPHPSQSSQPDDLSTWAPWLGGILEYDPLWGLAHGFYGPDSGDPEYGFWQDPDGDGLSNLLECYGDTDPFVGASKFQASFAGTGKHLHIQWSGADGLMHYQLEIPVEFTFLNEFEPAAGNFLHFGSSLGNFFGAQPQHRSDPFRIQAFVAGETRTHVSPDFVEDDSSIPGVVMDQNFPVVFEADDDGSAYLKWTGADGFPYVVRMRMRLGDWYWGRAGSSASLQPGSSAASFFRLSAIAPEDSSLLSAAEWGALTSGPHAWADWDADGIPNKWEVDHDFDPIDASSAFDDPDGDVLNNYEEYLDGRHPHVADVQSILVTCVGIANADPGWHLDRERWDLADGWIENVVVADVGTPGATVDHAFGERYRYTMTPGPAGGAVPDTDFLPVGPHEPYWQEETGNPEYFDQGLGGQFQQVFSPPSTGSSSSLSYPTTPQPNPIPLVRIFQTFLPHLNLPPCLLHNNNRDEYKPGALGADHEDSSIMMKHPLTGDDTGVLMFNDLMKGTAKDPLLYVAPALGRILQTPLTDFRIVLNNPLPGETGRLRFHALMHRHKAPANKHLNGKPLSPSLEQVIEQDTNLADQFLVQFGPFYGWEFFVEGIAEGIAPYSLEWRFNSILHNVWSAKTDVLDRQLAFSDNLSVAEGFGKWSIGGRCGPVIQVTTTDDYQPGDPVILGSLRAALEDPGPKTINFDNLVSATGDGTIALKAPLRITDPFVTINGQTAPGMGICLRDEGVEITADHVIIRYLRCRPGDTTGGTRYPLVGPNDNKDTGNDHDCFSIYGARHVILDHCSASWAIDETISVGDKDSETDNVTLQWCLMSSGLKHSIHAKTHGSLKLDHGYGSILNASRGAKYSVHHSMYAHIVRRNPRFQNKWAQPFIPGQPNGSGDPVGGFIDFRNNVIYNWGNLGGRPAAGMNFDGNIGSLLHYNLVNNFYRIGVDTDQRSFDGAEPARFLIMEEYNGASIGHYSGNQLDTERLDPNLWGSVPVDQRELVNLDGPLWIFVPAFEMDHPETALQLRYEEPIWNLASQVPGDVYNSAGASKARDPVDTAVLQEFLLKQGQIIDSQNDFEHEGSQGWPYLQLNP